MDRSANRGVFLGLALTAAATLMLEIVLTRVFSVIMWYHMSLVAVSMAMFGMTLGALIVHWRPEAFRPENAARACARHSLWFGVAVVFSLLVCLSTPFRVDTTLKAVTPNTIFLVMYWNAIAALPFVFSGIAVCTALTRFPRQIGKLYAADLGGAAAACLVVVWLLNHVGALSAIILIGAVALLASMAFAVGAEPPSRKLAPRGILFLVVAALGLVNSSAGLIRLQYALGQYIGDDVVKHEFWNAFSYVRVWPSRAGHHMWGTAVNPPFTPGAVMHVEMDTRASTPMMSFGGDWKSIDYLNWDASNAAQQLRKDGEVLVIGTGGGRDVLSALIGTQGQRHVIGVDINPIMIDLLTNLESEYSGNLGRLPHVSFFNDEARSWAARTKERFQIITIPLVDTSAASAAGAFALTENNLYTTEAFELFLNRLTDDGILSVSRWWHGGRIGETHRLVVMAAAALRHEGVADPRAQLAVVRGGELSTLLMARRPFTAADRATLEGLRGKYGFDLMLLPGAGSSQPELVAAAENPDWPDKPAFADVNVHAPTDDQPFFFHSYRLSNFFQPSNWARVGSATYDKDAISILVGLVLLVTLLGVAVVVVPLVRERRRSSVKLAAVDLETIAFFTAIGVAFMFFEAAQMQRLSIFLGYPIYALTVALFALLLSSSVGASYAGRLYERRGPDAIAPLLGALIPVLVVVGLATRPVIHHWESASTPVRVIVAALLVAPPGFFMGTAFPLGLRLGQQLSSMSLAWCWAVNGMASTCAAVYGIALSISMGFATTFWSSLVCYVVAAGLALRLVRRLRDTAAAKRPSLAQQEA